MDRLNVLGEQLRPLEPPSDARFLDIEYDQLERHRDDMISRLRVEIDDEQVLLEAANTLDEHLRAVDAAISDPAITLDELRSVAQSTVPTLVDRLNSLSQRHTEARFDRRHVQREDAPPARIDTLIATLDTLVDRIGPTIAEREEERDAAIAQQAAEQRISEQLRSIVGNINEIESVRRQEIASSSSEEEINTLIDLIDRLEEHIMPALQQFDDEAMAKSFSTDSILEIGKQRERSEAIVTELKASYITNFSIKYMIVRKIPKVESF